MVNPKKITAGQSLDSASNIIGEAKGAGKKIEYNFSMAMRNHWINHAVALPVVGMFNELDFMSNFKAFTLEIL